MLGKKTARGAAPPGTNASAERGAWVLRAGRIGGLTLALCGIATLLLALWEIWQLYRDPQSIVTLAAAIQQATGVDGSLVGAAVTRSADPEGAGPYTFSYFLAWLLKLVLLALIGKMAFWSVQAGRALLAIGPEAAAKEAAKQEKPKETDRLPPDYRPSHRQPGRPLQ